MNILRQKQIRYLILASLLVGVFIFLQDQTAFAAFDPGKGYNDGILKDFDQTNGANTGIAGLKTMLGNFGSGFTSVAQTLAIIMTATAAIMVGFGVQEGRQVVWSWILAIGLALNFAPILWSVFGSVGGLDTVQGEQQVSSFSVAISAGSDASFNLLRDFSSYYHEIIYKAASHIVPYSIRICLVLTAIDATMQLGLKLVEGDKVKFLVSKFLNCGIYVFLIMNWVGYGSNGNSGWHLMPNLMNGFKGLGYAASDADGTKFIADGVVSNAVMVITKYFSAASDASIPLNVFLFIVGIFVVIMMLLIALEMIMATLEFDTMALLTLPLLAFGVIPQLKFLSEKAIQTMFNCAIKCMCIAFLATVVNDVLSSYIEKFTGSSAISNTWFEQFGNVLTFVVLVFMLWIMIRKMPQLVQGLLSGNPSLSGGDMMGTLKSAANTGVSAVNGVGSAIGQVAGAYQAAKNENGGPFSSKLAAIGGTLQNLMKSTGMDAVPGIKGYRSGSASVRQSLSRVASNKEGYKPEKNDDDKGPGPGPGGSPPPSGDGKSSTTFEPKEKSLSDKAKSTAGGVAGGVVGEKAGNAVGTMAAGPAGGVVGGIAGSIAGDVAGSDIVDNASENNESDNSTQTEDNGDGGASDLPDSQPTPPPPQAPQPSRRRSSQEELPQESKKEGSGASSNTSTTSDDASRIRELQSENSGLKMDNAILRNENSGLRGGSSSKHNDSD